MALARHGIVEINGTEGTLLLPDPNLFEGRAAYVRPLTEAPTNFPIQQQWIEVEQEGAVAGRGLGLLEMARAIAEDRDHRASGQVGYHVLDVMLSAEQSAVSGEFLDITSRIDPIPTMPIDFDPFARAL